MDFKDLVTKRFSARKYTTEAVCLVLNKLTLY